VYPKYHNGAPWMKHSLLADYDVVFILLSLEYILSMCVTSSFEN
jgi:hypothetical protein